MELVIGNVKVLAATGQEPSGRWDVTVADGSIAGLSAAGRRRKGVALIDGTGTTLMPGLTDAHVHFGLVGKRGDHGDAPLLDHVLKVREVIESALQQGFTTVRDAGGLDPAWARAVAAGKLRGPRILPSGSMLSQTGGHGDLRAAHEFAHRQASIPGLLAANEIVDGIEAVRWAARDQLRKGATQVKLLASGGLASPTDPLDSVQFAIDEIRAAVDVAAGWGTYVLAHCHTSPAVERALEGGVRSIEHASFLREETAHKLKDANAFHVPTLLTLDELVRHPEQLQLTEEKLRLAQRVAVAAKESVELAHQCGVRMGSGSDLIGPGQAGWAREIVAKAQVIGPYDAIVAATRTNAELFQLSETIGTVEVGKAADLLLLAADPLQEMDALADPSRVTLVLKAGEVVRDTEERFSQ